MWLLVGWGAVILGMIGIVLPVLPTTPFMILAVFAFGKSSPRLAQWLRTHPRFGPMIQDWHDHRAIRPRHKRMALGMMAAVWLVSLVAGAPVWVLGVQAVCMGGAGVFIATRSNGPAS
ncbi:MAG: YbaN family protein [Paracoccaceae bacterium]